MTRAYVADDGSIRVPSKSKPGVEHTVRFWAVPSEVIVWLCTCEYGRRYPGQVHRCVRQAAEILVGQALAVAGPGDVWFRTGQQLIPLNAAATAARVGRAMAIKAGPAVTL